MEKDPNNNFSQNPLDQQFGQQFGGNFGQQQNLPNSVAVLVLGIVSIVTCICYGVPGLICGIVALALAGKATRDYNQNPSAYTLSSYNNMKAGKICAIIGVVLSVLMLLYVIFIFTFAISGGIFNMGNWDRY